MRVFSGIVLFIIGIGLLGLWGWNSHAQTIEEKIAASTIHDLGDTIHPVSASVSGRDITVTGLADTDEERADVIARMMDVTGRREVHDELRTLDAANPFRYGLSKTTAGIAASGNVPTEAMRGTIAQSGVENTAELALASGSSSDWMATAQAMKDALAPLEKGQIDLVDNDLMLQGTALGPKERDIAMAALDGTSSTLKVHTDIALLDDGTPAAFDFVWRPPTGANAVGKLPKGFTRTDMASLLGQTSVGGEAEPGLIDDRNIEALSSTFGAMKPWLSYLEMARLSYRDGVQQLDVVAAPGMDPSVITTKLQNANNDLTLSITSSSNTPKEGAVRINAQDEKETMRSGFWLPMVNFSPDAATCGTQTENALAAAKIEFISGSAELGPSAVTSINRIASIMHSCILGAGLNAQLGGHTDNTGDPNKNNTLSRERAKAVRNAMIARGLPAQKIIAVGFGDTEPVADNATEEGRADNRRTTIRWSSTN